MNRAWMMLPMLAWVLAGCAGPTPPLVVKQLTLRKAKPPDADDPMVRGEVQRRLHGAVTTAERLDRIGQYYTVLWRDDNPGAAVEVIFDYQQAATGSVVKRMTRTFEAGAAGGCAEFEVTGENLRKNGRVLAWRVALRRGERELASKQSYLWEDFP